MLSAIGYGLLWALTATPPSIGSASGPGAGSFVQNRGQCDSRAMYVASSARSTLFATATGFRVAIQDPNGGATGVAIFFDLIGRTSDRPPLPRDPSPTRFHSFLGNDPAQWIRDARCYESLEYREIQPGIDLLLRMRNGMPSFDLVVTPSGDSIDAPIFDVEGVDDLRIGASGELIATTAFGPIQWTAPQSFKLSEAGARLPVASRWEVVGRNSVRFRIEDGASSQRIVVDPDLEFSTYFGGVSSSKSDVIYDVAVDASGAPFVTGSSQSIDFPTTPGAYDLTLALNEDAFLAKFSPDGSTLVFATLFGAAGYERGLALAIDADGELVVAGDTDSLNLPTTPGAFDTQKNGTLFDGFVAKFAADGSSLVFSSYLGGLANDVVNDLAIDPMGSIYAVGTTNSSQFPVTQGAFDTLNASFDDAFVSKFAADGSSLAYSTLLGASGVQDWGRSIAVDAHGDAYVTGVAAAGFPVTHGGFDETINSGADTYVVRLNSAGSALVAGTFLGGPFSDLGTGLALSPDGAVLVSGNGAGTGFPLTPGAFDTSPGSSTDSFVAKLSPTLDSLIYSTLLGGNENDSIRSIASDAVGSAIVCGEFLNPTSTFPTTPGAILASSGTSFLSRVSSDGSRLQYSTYLSTGIGIPYSVATNGEGGAFVVGLAGSGWSTTPGAFDGTVTSIDGFLTKFDLCPGAADEYGVGCVGAGSITPQLAATGCPSSGFAMTLSITDAVGPTQGFLLMGTGNGTLPLAPNCAIQVAPILTSAVIPLPLGGTGPGTGSVSLTAVVPSGITVIDLTFQAVVLDPLGANGVAATNALLVQFK